jgi:ubiquinone/menaquinone biosynthesis C-methylase UbiE
MTLIDQPPPDATPDPTDTVTDAASEAPDPAEALTERIFGAALGALDLYTIYLGDTLGLYRVLATGPGTSTDVAARAGIDERYAREWLEQQAVSGFLQASDGDAASRTFSLAPGVDTVLLDEISPFYMGAMGRFAAAVPLALPELLAAFRSGAGVPWSSYGPDAVAGQAAFNRPAFTHELVQDWLPAAASIRTRLLDQSQPARVADVACGAGWSVIELAKAFPWITVDGYDVDEASILMARSNAVEQGVSDRVTFHVCGLDGIEPPATPYDAAFVFEAVHDMSRPVDVLTSIRKALAPGGHLLVVDERAEEFTAPAEDPVQQLLYASSVLVCLPTGRDDEVSAETGAMMQTDTFRGYADAAGFSAVEVLPVEHFIFRLYDLTA